MRQKKLRLQLRLFACVARSRRRSCRLQGVGMVGASDKRSVLPENCGRTVSIVTKTNSQTEKIHQRSYGAINSSLGQRMRIVSQTIVKCAVGIAMRIIWSLSLRWWHKTFNVLSGTYVESGDHCKLQKLADHPEKSVSQSKRSHHTLFFMPRGSRGRKQNCNWSQSPQSYVHGISWSC